MNKTQRDKRKPEGHGNEPGGKKERKCVYYSMYEREYIKRYSWSGKGN